jgi:hypothetical protein
MRTTTYNSEEFDYPYLACAPSRSNGPLLFEKFLKKRGFRLNADLSPSDLIDWEWIVPELRVSIPERCIQSLEAAGEFEEEDRWAAELWSNRGSGFGSANLIGRDKPRPVWWLHPFDDHLAVEYNGIRANALRTAEEWSPPASVVMKSGRTVAPYIYYLGYWAIYAIVEIDELCRSYHTITPHSEQASREEYERRRVAVADQVGRMRKEWGWRTRTFRWIARYRALRSHIATHHSIDAAAAQRELIDKGGALSIFAADNSLTSDAISEEVREMLLVMWHGSDSLHSRNRSPYRALLREDIRRALQMHAYLGGKKVDIFDPFWHSEKRSDPGRANLADALPYEEALAERGMAHRVAQYLRVASSEAALIIPKEVPQLDKLLKSKMEGHPALVRVALALHRLAAHLKGDSLYEDPAVMNSYERIEQLLLAVLHTEKVLAKAHRLQNPRHVRHAEVGGIIRYHLDRALATFTNTKANERTDLIAQAK